MVLLKVGDEAGYQAQEEFKSRSGGESQKFGIELVLELETQLLPSGAAIYTPCFCVPPEAARTIKLRSSRSKRLATVRNSYANSSKAALVSSSLVL
jgi:hypothetical protein